MTFPDTGDLIRRLAADGTRVRPLARPWIRAAIWSGVSLASLLLLYVLWPHSMTASTVDSRFVIEQAAALATGLTAAAAAFVTVVPGRSRRLAMLPLVPLTVWLVSLGQMCARDWSAAGHLPPTLVHWGCFPATIVAGIVPAIAMVVMLRRGAPLTPRLTTALAALAVAGVANFGIRFVHSLDASFVVLAWHVAAVFGLSAIATMAGDRVFGWRPTTRRA